MPLKLTTYYHSKDIPELPENNTFHSKDLFEIYEEMPGYAPFLIVASIDHKPIGKIMVLNKKIKTKLPFITIWKSIVNGMGEYFNLPNSVTKEEIFDSFIDHITQEGLRTSSIIEFKYLNNALLGYKHFRTNHYYPVNRLRIQNSLHSQSYAEERFDNSKHKQIKRGLKNGAVISEVKDVKQIKAFSKTLYKFKNKNVQKFFPNKMVFEKICNILLKKRRGRIYIIRYKKKIIGGSISIKSEDNIYLWFSGAVRKNYNRQQPGVLAIWKAFQKAFEQKYKHIVFMDVGIPFKKNEYKNFILGFGGKQMSVRRWYRIRWAPLNKIMVKLYR